MKNRHKMHYHREFTCQRDVTLADPRRKKSAVVWGTSTFREIFCCKYFLFFISFIFAQIKSSLMPFLKFISFRPPDFTMENSQSYVFFCWFFATTAHQRIIFMVLVKTILVQNSVKVSDFSLQYSCRKSKKSVI